MDRRTSRPSGHHQTARWLRLAWLIAVLWSAPLAVLTPAAQGVEYDGPWVWPVVGPHGVIRGFEPPRSEWSAGHRGVDLRADIGDPIRAIGAGTVTFAGDLAGRGVVVVTHGKLRSTYEPLIPLVSRGDQVVAGETTGLLSRSGSHCAPADCLHLGVRRGDDYLDPLSLLGPRRVRLLPLAPSQATSTVGSGRADSSDGRSPDGPTPSPGPAERAAAGGALGVVAALMTAWARRGGWGLD